MRDRERALNQSGRRNASRLPLLLAAGLPLVAVVLTQIPLASLVKWIVNTIV
jgi:phosphohistidine phosphatase SixA